MLTTWRGNRLGSTASVCGLIFGVVLLACGGRPPGLVPELKADAQQEFARRAQRFEEFPLVWLGESYDTDGDGNGDLPLVAARKSTSKPLNAPDGTLIRPGHSSFLFAYGQCKPPDGDEGGCPTPVSIRVYSPCDGPVLSDLVKRGATSVRGVEAVIHGSGESLWIETQISSCQSTLTTETRSGGSRRILLAPTIKPRGSPHLPTSEARSMPPARPSQMPTAWTCRSMRPKPWRSVVSSR